MHEHPEHETFERYVHGALEPPLAAALEAHVATCARCAAQLGHEARLEMALAEVAAAGPRRAPRGTGRTWLGVGLGALAAAAAAVLVVARSGAPMSSEAILYACPDDALAERCVASARRHGRVIEYPRAQLVVPRYEAMDLAAPALDARPRRLPATLEVMQ